MEKEFVISDESRNEYDFIVLSGGIKYGENIPMLFNHDMEKPAIGHWKDIKLVANELTGTGVFDMDDEFGAKLANKVDKGHIKAVSIGAVPLSVEWRMVEGKDTMVVTSCRLKEVSIVNVGANRNAITLYDNNDNVINLADKEAIKLSFSKIVNPKKENMANLIALGIALGLTAQEPTEDMITRGIIELKAENSKLKAEYESATKAAKAKQAEEIKLMLDTAEADKKILPTERAHYEKLFELAFDSTKAILDAKTAPVIKLSDITAQGGGTGDGKIRHLNLTFGELSKQKPDELIKLRDTNFELFKQMYKSEYGKEYTK